MADTGGTADPTAPAPETARVFAFSLSLLFNRPLRRALGAIGLRPRLGLPGRGDIVLVWGRKPVARRGLAIARWRGARVLTLEDGFLRSVRTGRDGDPPHGLVVDDLGIYFDTASQSRLSTIMDALSAQGASPQTGAALARYRASGLSKYTPPPDPHSPPESFVLVVDQTRGDASITGAGADAATFARMLAAARQDHPQATILVKSHPEVTAAHRRGHYEPSDLDAAMVFWPHATPIDQLLSRASAVYCVSSLMGLEAILHGHRPVVFGDAVYAGRGLTDDRHPRTPQRPPLTPETLFEACYLRYCRWVDPVMGEEAGFEAVCDQLEDTAQAARFTHRPVVMYGMRLWKRGFLRRMFPGLIRFSDDPAMAARLAAQADGAVLAWAGKVGPELVAACGAANMPLVRMEDGFVRSAGLGAELVAPASLALDDLGIYYDPSGPSRLERLIASSVQLRPDQLARAARLRDQIVRAGVSKYNLRGAGQTLTAPPGREVILVPGQVEDDQSILKGAGAVATNAALLAATRNAFPEAFIVYKPHPDVVAGLREGGSAGMAAADQVVARGDIAGLLAQVDRVATMTSLTGFEALLRGIPVTVFGQPFYAGWGLTDDRTVQPERRRSGVTLDGLVHAALIDYPAYWDPVTGLPCRAETIVARLQAGATGRRAPWLRALAKVQGAAASYAHLWRR